MSTQSRHRFSNGMLIANIKYFTCKVNALVERRPVSSVLESATFRQSLEQSLRGIIQRGGASRALLSAASRRSPSQVSAVSPAQSSAASSLQQSALDLSNPVEPQAASHESLVTPSEPVLANWLNNQQQAG